MAESNFVFDSVFLGHMDERTRKAFFNHIKGLKPWRDHPVLCNPTIQYEKLIPCTIHADGAQFYRDDEVMVYSFASAFGQSGMISDVLLHKFPLAMIPERWMMDYSESLFETKFVFLIW